MSVEGRAAKDSPSIDFMVKDYESFRQLMLDRLSATLPVWQERHAPDLGIALIETFAYVADYLSYYQDAAATEAYLGTARQRISVRRHARLLDYRLHEGCNARTFVHVRFCAQVNHPKCFSFKAEDAQFFAIGNQQDPALPAPSVSNLESLPQGSYEIFKPVGGGTIAVDENLNCLNVVGVLQKGDTQAELGLSGGVAPQVGSVLILEAANAAKNSVTHYHPVAITRCRVSTSGAKCWIAWHPDDAVPERMHGLAARALGNIVLVDHGRWVTDETAGSDMKLVVQGGRAGPLRRQGVTHRAPLPHGSSAAAMTVQEPRLAIAEASLKVGCESWGSVRADLLESFASDRHFCVEVDDSGFGWIQFGDGNAGAKPAEGVEVEPTYRIGNGPAGNIPAGAIRRMLLNDGRSFDVTVTNPMEGRGGREPESAATARLLAPGEMRINRHRAISAEDYAEVARGVDGVANAAVAIAPEGSRRVVCVALDPVGWFPREDDKGALKADWDKLKERVLRRLEGVRRINHDVVVTRPVPVELEIHLRITIYPDHDAEKIKQEACRRLTGPGADAFFHPDNLTFGQPIYWSRIAASLHDIAGVASVEPCVFGRRPVRDQSALPAMIEIGPREIANRDGVDPQVKIANLSGAIIA